MKDAPVLNTLLTDTAATSLLFNEIAEGYFFLASAAKLVKEIPETPPGVLERALARTDVTGNVLDAILDLLQCKVNFSTAFLLLTCAPIDVLVALAIAKAECSKDLTTPEQILQLEALRHILQL